MRFITAVMLTMLSGCASDFSAEQSKFQYGQVCQEMVGIWFTDVTVENVADEKKRDITRLHRKVDGSAYLKGVSVYYTTNEIVEWEFAIDWSCDGKWYVESREWGETSFKVISLGKTRNILSDIRNNWNASTPIKIVEKRSLNTKDDVLDSPSVRDFLEL